MFCGILGKVSLKQVKALVLYNDLMTSLKLTIGKPDGFYNYLMNTIGMV